MASEMQKLPFNPTKITNRKKIGLSVDIAIALEDAFLQNANFPLSETPGITCVFLFR